VKERSHLKDLGVVGGKHQNGSSRRGMDEHGLDWSRPGQGQVVNTCESGNDSAGSIKCGKFLD
jgi:hypothetical protein